MKDIVAVDYKGKHFILEDADRVDEFDYVDEEISIEYILSEKGLRNHVIECDYYGIPPYIGDDEGLHTRIKKIQNENT